MGAGKKVAIGCGGLLLLMVFAGFLGWRWMDKNLGVTMNEDVIAERLASVASLHIPEGFEAVFSTYTEAPLKNPMIMFILPGTRSQETSLVIFEYEGYLSEEDLIREVTEGGSGMRVSVGQEDIGETERFPVTFEGVEYSAMLQEGLDDNQNVERLLMAVLPSEKRTLMIVLLGDPTLLPQRLLQSILNPDSEATSGLPTPPTDEGKTSESDQ